MASASAGTPLFTRVVEGAMLVSVSAVGCVGNVFAIIGLARNRRMTRSFSTLLIALAIADLLYLVMGVLIFGLPALSEWYKKKVFPYILPVCYGLAHVGRVGSALLTLSVSVERYYSVCHPLRPFAAKRALLPVTVVFTIVYNLPKFFEHQLSFKENGEPFLDSSWLRNNPKYVIFYLFLPKFVLVELCPYVIMVVLNYLIWRRVQQLIKIRKQTGAEQGPMHEEEIDLAGILISVVSIFIVCQSVKLVPDIYEVFMCDHRHPSQGECVTTREIEYIIDVSHLSLTINSSVNFLIYIIKGGEFSNVLLQMLRPLPRSPSNHTNGGRYEMVVASPNGRVTSVTGRPVAAATEELLSSSKTKSSQQNQRGAEGGEEGKAEDSTAAPMSVESGVCTGDFDHESEDQGQLNKGWPFMMYDMTATLMVDEDETKRTQETPQDANRRRRSDYYTVVRPLLSLFHHPPCSSSPPERTVSDRGPLPRPASLSSKPFKSSPVPSICRASNDEEWTTAREAATKDTSA